MPVASSIRSLSAQGWDEPTRYPERMGLDAVDIVLRCEETFDLRIEDKDAGQINTQID